MSNFADERHHNYLLLQQYEKNLRITENQISAYSDSLVPLHLLNQKDMLSQKIEEINLRLSKMDENYLKDSSKYIDTKPNFIHKEEVEKCLSLLAKNEVEKVISILYNHCFSNHFQKDLDSVVLISARWNDLKESKINRTKGNEEVSIVTNQIIESLLLIIRNVF